MTATDLDAAIEKCERIMEMDTRTMQNPVSENGWIFEKVYELLKFLRQFQFETGGMDDTISRIAVLDAIDGVEWYHQNQHGEMVSGANSDKHQAWYVPMDYTITAEDAKNFTFYKLHMVAGAAEAGEADPNQIYLYVTPMNVGEKLVGNRPYTVKPKAAKENYKFTAENTILYAPNNGSRLNVTTSTHSYDFFGQYENTNYSGNKGDMYYLSQGALHPNNPTTPLLPYRWNIKVSSNSTNDGYAKIGFIIIEDEEATSINTVRDFNADEVEGIYSINGKKLNTPVKGINIIKYKNGKTEKRLIK